MPVNPNSQNEGKPDYFKLYGDVLTVYVLDVNDGHGRQLAEICSYENRDEFVKGSPVVARGFLLDAEMVNVPTAHGRQEYHFRVRVRGWNDLVDVLQKTQWFAH